MILHPIHDIFTSSSTDPIFKYGDQCVLSMREITHNLHSENGYITKGVKYMIYNYHNIDHRMEFFVGEDDENGIDMNNVRGFLKNFMREDEFRMSQIVEKQKNKLELLK
jgi:hypothetical protein